jgi:predicted Rossmann fold flavoprotein
MVKKTTKHDKTKAKKIIKSPKKKEVSSSTTKYNLQSTKYDVCIIGGGPAGLMAACKAGEEGKKVLVIEKNDELGKKLLISGGGRCNLTNANPNHREFVSKFGKKGNFLFSPFSIFGVQDTIIFFNNLGLKTKVEAGFRVFPESDNSGDVLMALVNRATGLGVEFKLNTEVTSLSPFLDKKGVRGQLKNQKSISGVILKSGEMIEGKKFILTTGGMSHPETGSTGDGFKWLKEIGHKVTESKPSLVPIKIREDWISELSGISLDNVGITVSSAEQNQNIKKKGRILFTHNGLSGPTILNMSKSIGELLEYKTGEVILALDFFPGVGLDQIHEMMLKTFETNVNRKIKNLTFKEVPAKIFELILKQLEIDPEWEINEVKREERLALIEKFKKFEMKVGGLLGYDKAIISSGGLDLTEVDFKTMSSRIYKNLYFAGDILDFDRPSGGFSLQLCWTTGYIAGMNN